MVAENDRAEVARHHTTEPTFCVLHTRDYGILSDQIVECVHIYQRSNEGFPIAYPLVMQLQQMTRMSALGTMALIKTSLHYARKHHDLQYTIDWWWRTPSNAGVDHVLIGFRVCGIYELVND